MAELIIHSEKIKENIQYLSRYFKTHHIEWSLVTKIFSGDKTFIANILSEDVMECVNSVCDSKLSSLKYLKKVFPKLKTIYINPPAPVRVDEVIDCANISCNTSITTIKALNAAAEKKDVVHKIIIMIELGELREGIHLEDLASFYEAVSDLSHIEVVGVGSNLGCMFGVEPTEENLAQLALSKRFISETFHKELKFISGGTSITLPLLENGLVPKDINHFRVGEAAFLGICPLEGEQFKDLHKDTFELHANIIELIEKNISPGGNLTTTSKSQNSGRKNVERSQKSYKAILDFGLLDVDKNDLQAEDDFLFVGATSDMVVIDVGNNQTASGGVKYCVGDTIKFSLNYIAVARLLSSKFIHKIYV
ncbi:alanine racemase [Winogradskyella sediminis]|uniref:Predicted amino acid racemase n=1 Tax=Winogradskyella sediminis TaxID=1382466 RepID=A0A1H1W4F5_9FLAO|nr:alanine racemase [Winogradskyella sediminis]SDS91935.1 Predicted amino acid racemase [Winogradskyella sediminis]